MNTTATTPSTTTTTAATVPAATVPPANVNVVAATSNKKKQHICPYCSLTLSDRSHLNRHVANQHPSAPPAQLAPIPSDVVVPPASTASSKRKRGKEKEEAKKRPLTMDELVSMYVPNPPPPPPTFEEYWAHQKSSSNNGNSFATSVLDLLPPYMFLPPESIEYVDYNGKPITEKQWYEQNQRAYPNPKTLGDLGVPPMPPPTTMSSPAERDEMKRMWFLDNGDTSSLPPAERYM